MNEIPDQPRPTTFTITGRNQYGEVVTETITSDMLNDPFVQELGYITREKYASIGLDLDAELDRMMKKSKWRAIKQKAIRGWYIFWRLMGISFDDSLF